MAMEKPNQIGAHAPLSSSLATKYASAMLTSSPHYLIVMARASYPHSGIGHIRIWGKRPQEARCDASQVQIE